MTAAITAVNYENGMHMLLILAVAVAPLFNLFFKTFASLGSIKWCGNVNVKCSLIIVGR